MIHQIFAVWSLIPLPLLNSACTSESCQFTYFWCLAWRILSITLLACEVRKIVRQFEHSLALPVFNIGMKADLFQSRGHGWVFQIFLVYWVQHFNSVIFRIWNSPTGISSPPLNLFITMLPKAHLTSHSRMSSSWWVTTPSWLFGSLRPFFYSSSMYSFIILWQCSFLSLFFWK